MKEQTQNSSSSNFLKTDGGKTKSNAIEVPSISLPKGGGAIKGIDEKFSVNAVNGTAGFSIPLPFSPARGASPALTLGYNSGSGNGIFGLGWNLSLGSIKRKTDKGLPQYLDTIDSDTFLFSEAEDLVPEFKKNDDGSFLLIENEYVINERDSADELFTIRNYKPRIEGLFARIERWTQKDNGRIKWRVITKENTTTLFGWSDNSILFNPKDSTQIYEWLPEFVFDDKGNCSHYIYKPEDNIGFNPALIHNKNRINGGVITYTNLYLDKILYGNQTPYPQFGVAFPSEADYLFQTVFDYGTTDPETDPFDRINPWDFRLDAFSDYKAGFEIRTTRLCKRVLLFHVFEELAILPDKSDKKTLIKSVNFEYDTAIEQDFTFLSKIRAFGYIKKPDGSYSHKSLPPMEFTYQAHDWSKEVKTASMDALVHAPTGIEHPPFQFVDLYNEGLSGILTEQANGWYYKHNLGIWNNEGNAELMFEHAKLVSPKPSFAGLGDNYQLADLDGDGGKQLVSYGAEPRGYFELDDDNEWHGLRSFKGLPNIDFSDPNTRMLDLNGDGKPEVVISEDSVFTWYASEGRDGYATARKTPKSFDEEAGPHIVFADSKQTIYLADMSGDGMTDILRIRNGEVCYWPNLGYGKFGAKVAVDNAPVFDHPDAFNPNYLRLADIDGSGTSDIIYLGKNKFTCWKNLSGNRFVSVPFEIEHFPEINSQSKVTVTDLLGNGVACIVWSSSLEKDAHAPLRYIDLMNSKKPHIMVSYKNNMGKEVSMEYTPSTKFYIEDKLAGKPWVTKLHFPVHCVSKTITEDKIRNTIFTSTYSYRHGYYDYEEQEFRGFAQVEQFDTEDFEHFKLNDAKNVVEEQFHQPPVRSISWFHTGAFLRNKKIIHQCEAEYFENSDFEEYKIPDALLPNDLTSGEIVEAYRACKGVSLRSEVYSNDGSDKSAFPYSAQQLTAEIKLVQPKGKNKHASFLVIPSESISYGYDRNPTDPHISQSFVLETDDLGNTKKSAIVVYPRVARPASIPDKVWEEQSKIHMSYDEALFTNDIITDTVYRLRTGYESTSFEISGITQPVDFFFQKENLKAQIASATQIHFEEEFTDGIQKRLLAQQRAYFMNDAFSGARPLGELSPLGIGYRSHLLAYTQNLVTKYYGAKVTDQMLIDAKYVHSENDEHWWIPSGDNIFAPDPKSNFYALIAAKDLLGNESFVEYDRYSLLVNNTTDAIGNVATAVNDYRTLSPIILIDSNSNRSAVETDELGMVIKSAVMGKVGTSDGDTLEDPTTRLEYDLFNWLHNGKPNVVHTFAREKHGPTNTRWQESYAYSDGSGEVVMAKSQVNAGKANRWNTITKEVEEVDANPRWIGNGRIIVNNKGKAIKQFEPYFSTTFEFESEDALVETGISPIMYYDSLGRNIRTVMPNGTFSRVTFDAWHFSTYDAHDTVKHSEWYADRGSPDPLLIPEPSDPEQRAAWLAAKHHDTPSVTHIDCLGRTFYNIIDYGGGRTSVVYSESDASRRYSKAFDQLGRMVSESYVNLLGQNIYGKSAEKGENWVFADALGRLVKIWDNDIREYRTTFDGLHRPTGNFVKEGLNETLFGYVVYGDSFPAADAEAKNLKGRIYQIYDQAGVVTIKNIDFKGNPIEAERRLTREYKEIIDWSVLDGLTNIAQIETLANPLLETETFSSSSTIDALGRPISVVLPDNSIFQPIYNEGSGLKELNVQIRGTGPFVNFLESQDYDAKGRRQFAKYGNGTITKYFYDPKTFRLVNLLTKQRSTDADAQSLQDLKYTFDAVGNIVQIRDDAQQAHYFNNAVVLPESKFEYDAMYQLTSATGREHSSLVGNAQRTDQDIPFVNQLPHQNNAAAVRRYTENYEYDSFGNITRIQHIAAGANWNQRFQYEYETDSTNQTNRLKASNNAGDPDGVFSSAYTYDSHGNMTKMPHLSQMVWNFMDQLKEVDLGGGGKAFYVYGLGGNRIRKVIERNGGRRTERIYLGAIEIYRERQSNNPPNFERYTIYVSDNTGNIAQIDTKTLDVNNSDTLNSLNNNVVRYQYGNHLGSASLETDGTGNVISYEEYHPFGTSAYRVSRPDKNFSLKRYRYSGKERDDETGLYYFGARFYAAWLGRWTSSDPAGFVSGFNLYRYCSNNPVMFQDPDGMQERSIMACGATDSQGVLSIVELPYTPGAMCPDNLRVPPPASAAPAAPAQPQAPPSRPRPRRRPAAVSPPPLPSPAESAPAPAPATPAPAPASPAPAAPAQGSGSSRPLPTAPLILEATIQAIRNGSVPTAGNPLARTLRGLTTPRTFTPGQPLTGTYNLWSGGVQPNPSGAWPPNIRPNSGITNAAQAPGFIMEDTAVESVADDLARQLGHLDRFDVPFDRASGSDFNRVWGPTSDRLANQAGASQIPVESHGLGTHGTPSSTVQVTREIPRIQLIGGAMAGLSVLSGVGAVYASGHMDGIAGAGAAIGGVIEVTGAGIYIGGLAGLGSSETAVLMTVGRGMMGAGGGLAAAAMFGYQSAQDFRQGNTGWGVVNAIGAVAGGVLVAAALGLTAPAWGTAAAVVVGVVAVAGLARWIFS